MQIEDLKQRLDDALGAEDLVEQLTEKNLSLTEKLEEMRMAVEDLEALKELADELEENHVETEKQLQAEIGKGYSVHSVEHRIHPRLSRSSRYAFARTTSETSIR